VAAVGVVADVAVVAGVLVVLVVFVVVDVGGRVDLVGGRDLDGEFDRLGVQDDVVVAGGRREWQGLFGFVREFGAAGGQLVDAGLWCVQAQIVIAGRFGEDVVVDVDYYFRFGLFSDRVLWQCCCGLARSFL